MQTATFATAKGLCETREDGVVGRYSASKKELQLWQKRKLGRLGSNVYPYYLSKNWLQTDISFFFDCIKKRAYLRKMVGVKMQKL